MNCLQTSLRRGSSSGRSLVVVVVVVLGGLLCLLRLLSLFALVIKLVLMLVVPTPDQLFLWISFTINGSCCCATRLSLIQRYRGYLPLMSFYPQYLLFDISLVVSPEFPIGSSSTIVSQPINLGQLVVIKHVIAHLSGPSCLL